MSNVRDNKKIRLRSDIVYVNTLIDRIKSGEYLIPKFQRPLVWKPHQVKDLLDSIYKMYPIGSVFIWETHLDMRINLELGNLTIPGPKAGEARGYVIDGQQRLSTLAIVLGSDIEYEELNESNNKYKIYFDLDKEEFLQVPINKKPAPSQFPVNNINDTFKFLNKCQEILSLGGLKAQEYVEKAQYLAESLLRIYALPVVTIGNSTLEEAVKIFSRLNRSGTKITDDQMVSALSYREDGEEDRGFDLSDAITDIIEELENHSFRDIDRNLILRAILGEMELDLYRTDWDKVSSRRGELEDASQNTKQNMIKAIEFLHSEGITNEGLLPYTMQLVLISIFFKYYLEGNSQSLEILKRWFWVTSFTGWFTYGNATTIRWAIEDLKRIADGYDSNFKTIDLDEPAKPLPTNFNFSGGRLRVFGVFLSQLEPRDLVDGKVIDAKECLSDGYRAFPYIIRPNKKNKRYSGPENRILLGKRYHPHATGVLQNNQLSTEQLESHGIPQKAYEALRTGQNDEFLRLRREHLILREIQFMESKHVRRPQNPHEQMAAAEDYDED